MLDKQQAKDAAEGEALALPPDDPVFRLYESYRQAQVAYRRAVANVAQRSGLSLRSVDRVVKQACARQRLDPSA
jgi:hypothetical protein